MCCATVLFVGALLHWAKLCYHCTVPPCTIHAVRCAVLCCAVQCCDILNLVCAVLCALIDASTLELPDMLSHFKCTTDSSFVQRTGVPAVLSSHVMLRLAGNPWQICGSQQFASTKQERMEVEREAASTSLARERARAAAAEQGSDSSTARFETRKRQLEHDLDNAHSEVLRFMLPPKPTICSS